LVIGQSIHPEVKGENNNKKIRQEEKTSQIGYLLKYNENLKDLRVKTPNG
jgi:hypothetical protein